MALPCLTLPKMAPFQIAPVYPRTPQADGHATAFQDTTALRIGRQSMMQTLHRGPPCRIVLSRS